MNRRFFAAAAIAALFLLVLGGLAVGQGKITTVSGWRFFSGPVGIGTSPVAGLSLSAALPLSAPAWTARAALSATRTLTSASATYQFLDAGAANRDCVLPTAATGMSFVIKNYGVANNIVVKDAAATTLATLTPGDTTTVIYDGTAWQVL